MTFDASNCKRTFYKRRLTLLRQTVADLPMYVVVFINACPFQHALSQAESQTCALILQVQNKKTFVRRVQLTYVELVTAVCCHGTDPTSVIYFVYMSSDGPPKRDSPF